MPIQVRAAITTSGTAQQIIEYCNRTGALVCIGGGMPWLYPDVPPPPSMFIKQVPNQIGYFSVTRIVPIVKDFNGNIAVSLTEAWQTLPLDAEVLADKGCNKVLIEAAIVHNNLPASTSSYQSAGLYFNATQPIMPALPNLPTGYLDLIQQFGVVVKAINTTHVLRMVRSF